VIYGSFDLALLPIDPLRERVAYIAINMTSTFSSRDFQTGELLLSGIDKVRSQKKALNGIHFTSTPYTIMKVPSNLKPNFGLSALIFE